MCVKCPPAQVAKVAGAVDLVVPVEGAAAVEQVEGVGLVSEALVVSAARLPGLAPCAS